MKEKALLLCVPPRPPRLCIKAVLTSVAALPRCALCGWPTAVFGLMIGTPRAIFNPDVTYVLGLMTSMHLKALKALAIAAICLIAQIPFADAATYYLSSSQGNDTNSGTSTDAPWQSLRKVYLKGISTNIFTAGDSILLKAGDTFDGPLRLNNAGVKGSPVTISRYAAGANPIIYGDHPSVIWSAVAGHTGIYSADVGGGTSIETVYGISGNKYNVRSQGTNSLDTWLSKFVTNDWGGAYTSTIYVRTPDGNPPPQMHLFEWAAIAIGGSYITIENLDSRNGMFGIAASAGVGIITRNNSVQDTINIGIYYGSWCTSGEISTNVVTRTGETSIYLSQCGNVWAHHNTCSYSGSNNSGVYILGCHIPAGEQCGIGLERGTNNIVEYNSISYVYGSCFDYWLEQGSIVRYNYGFHTGGAAYPCGTGLKLHNNVFNLDGAGPGINASYVYDSTNSPGPDLGTNLTFNNVVFNFKVYGLYGIAGGSNTLYRNNVLITASTSVCMAQLGSGADSDYNMYYCTAGSPAGWSWNNPNINCSTLAVFKTTSGQEAHSHYANPQFVSASPVTAADFQFKSTSPCINEGQDLKRVGLLAPSQEYQDYLGTLIPQGRGPDIGAYEKGIGSLGPPTDLRIKQ